MRARALILLFLAVVLATGAAMLAHSWLAAQRSREVGQIAATPLQPTRSVLVARSDIARGQILKPEDFVWQPWPNAAINDSYLASGGKQTPQSFAGWVAVNPIVGGEPITEAKIIAPGNRGFLAAVLRPGMRAISVPVTVTSGISGFIFPGDRVDLLVTYPVPIPPGAANTASYQNKVTETVLHDIRVIGIDQQLQSKPGSAVVARTATFEVTPKESEAITLADEIGKLSLSLRSLVPAPGAHEIASGAGDDSVDPPDADGRDSSIARAATFTLDSEISPLLPGNSSAGTITILRGAAKTSETVEAQQTAGDVPGPVLHPSPNPAPSQ
jgi:pilus assembly protein CpaB